MLIKGRTVESEPNEPALRSCWECNGCHEHLKQSWFLHYCFSCDRYYIGDCFLDTFYEGKPDTPEGHDQARAEIVDWLLSLGFKDGESTHIRGGDQVIVIQMGEGGGA